MNKKDREQNQAFYDWWESQKVNLDGSVITLVHNEVLHYCSIMTTKTMQILQEPIPLLQMFGFI